MTENILNKLTKLSFMGLAILLFSLIACDADDPRKEDTPELITKVTLTFTPTGGEPIIVSADDPDGEGVQSLQVSGPIELAATTGYTLTIHLLNELVAPGISGYDLTAEVKEEGDEHLIFFSWTEGVFSSPEGNGNIDKRSGAVNYDDEDQAGLPLGLETSWTTGSPSSGKFRILLKHQPGLKSEDSSSTMGETDLDIEFDIGVE